jgi:hypothetical protein
MAPKWVFLDQNHWIYLAKAFWGKAQKPAHEGLPAQFMGLVKADAVRLPVDVVHLIECNRDEQPDRRHRLALVLEQYSQGWFIASWASIVRAELARALQLAFSPERVLPSPTVFGKGWPFGFSDELRADFGEKSTSSLDELLRIAIQPEALYRLLTRSNESNRLRQKQHSTELSILNATAAERLRAIRKPYGKDLHRRAQYAGYTYDFQDELSAALASMGRTLADFMALGIEELARFWSLVSSLDVDCELTLYRDRQWHRTVDPNDVRDIAHLVVAVPYCDVVVVERFWARALEETGLAAKYDVSVCTDLAEITTRL